MYTTPNEYYFRLHHVRPRFKNQVENVLGYVAFSIAQIGRKPTGIFNSRLNESIRHYGRNAVATQKTIDNWRTEIGALFGMYIEGKDGFTTPSQQTIDLANSSNLQMFFMSFIYSFQYPGGHIAAHAVKEIIDAGILFHPYKWIFRAFIETELKTIDKCEFCHCVLNDMRVTRDHEDISLTVERIIENRQTKVLYHSEGDVVRYACDLLDYAVLAGLLKVKNGVYSLNEYNRDVAKEIAYSNHSFEGYGEMGSCTIQKISDKESAWFEYVEQNYKSIKKKIAEIEKQRENAIEKVSQNGQEHLNEPRQSELQKNDGTSLIGEYGENLIFQHECLRVKKDGRKDLVHLIKRIPTHLAVGYDLKSIETDTEYDRYIEVKTTQSKRPLMFRQVHLTTNEWRVAQSTGNKYCVYRLMISDEGRKLFVIRDPIQKYKDNLLTFIPRDGVDITFSDAAGEEVELLCEH